MLWASWSEATSTLRQQIGDSSVCVQFGNRFVHNTNSLATHFQLEFETNKLCGPAKELGCICPHDLNNSSVAGDQGIKSVEKPALVTDAEIIINELQYNLLSRAI
jgi:hypothetical protein